MTDSADRTIRPSRGARTPILLWRWRLVEGSHVYRAVQPRTNTATGEETWVEACDGYGTESVLEPDGTERCLACVRALAR